MASKNKLSSDRFKRSAKKSTRKTQNIIKVILLPLLPWYCLPYHRPWIIEWRLNCGVGPMAKRLASSHYNHHQLAACYLRSAGSKKKKVVINEKWKSISSLLEATTATLLFSSGVNHLAFPRVKWIKNPKWRTLFHTNYWIHVWKMLAIYRAM